MKKYPLFRLKLVLAGNWHQFSNWLRENPMQEGEDIVFVREIIEKENEKIYETSSL